MNEFFSMPVGHDPSKAAQLICKQADKIAELEKERDELKRRIKPLESIEAIDDLLGINALKEGKQW
jgi:hypothetical protein